MSKETEIYLRKQQVWSLITQGFTQEQIADKLNVSPKTISRDFQELKKESIEWMNALPDGEIQLHHKKNFEMIDKILQELWKIYGKTKDEKEKVRILSTIAQKCKMHTDMMDTKHLLEIRSRMRSYADSKLSLAELMARRF